MFIEKRYKTEMYDPGQGRMSGCFVFFYKHAVSLASSLFLQTSNPKISVFRFVLPVEK
jgi:hypothetical protein